MNDAREVLRLVATRLHPDAPTPPSFGPLTVSPAILLVTQRYATVLTVMEMARAAQMSRFHFIRVFHRETGLTPHGFLMRYRIVRAMDLLKDTDRGVGRIGQEVGYLNAAAFSRAFAELAGLPPQVYRVLSRNPRAAEVPFQLTTTPPPLGQAGAFFSTAQAIAAV